MRHSLSELILNDLGKLHTKVVASEESIRLIIEAQRAEHTKLSLVHQQTLYAVLRDQILLNQPGHYQFFVENGQRSKIEPGRPGSVHYYAADLYIRANKKPIVFIADHFRGYHAYHPILKNLTIELELQVLVVGGRIYQADTTHCPIFTSQHLLLTSTHSIVPLLDSIIADPMKLDDNYMGDLLSRAFFFNWDQLPPAYLIHAQSIRGTLFNYIDLVKRQENLPKDLPSEILSNANFDRVLAPNLLVDPADQEQDKITNQAINHYALQIAGKAALQLESEAPDHERTLIDLCYLQRYPLVHGLLTDAYQVSSQTAEKSAHPLFELVFSQAGIFELSLYNDLVYSIFKSNAVLKLMQRELLDPLELFNLLTASVIYKDRLDIVYGNLSALEIIATHLEGYSETTKKDLFNCLTKLTTKAFFKNSELVKLYIQGIIPLSMIEKIRPHRLNNITLARLATPELKVEYLYNQSQIPSQLESFFTLSGDDSDNCPLETFFDFK